MVSVAPELQALIHLSNEIGQQLELIQGGGGNTSVKVGDTMYIKASGTPLKGMSVERGWVALNSQGQVTAGSGRPSMEWPMHLMLPRVVAHAHAVYTNVWLCQQGGLEKLAQKLERYQPVMIPYITPGHELAESIHQAIQGKHPQLLLLENHGIIACGETVEAVLQLINSVNAELKAELPPFSVVAQPEILPSVFPDAAVFTNTTALTEGVREILSANQYLHKTIVELGSTVKLLPATEGQKLRNMETEQYRMQQI